MDGNGVTLLAPAGRLVVADSMLARDMARLGDRARRRTVTPLSAADRLVTTSVVEAFILAVEAFMACAQFGKGEHEEGDHVVGTPSARPVTTDSSFLA